MERLQKLIARAGLASRREAERWIREGRVSVNGQRIDRPGVRVDPARDRVLVDGKPLRIEPARAYFVFHKPPGLVVTLRDPHGRPHLGQLLEEMGETRRLFPVGRLDFHSEGLLLLTNDGELANRLMHPRFGVEKRYLAKIGGQPSGPELDRLRRGIVLDGRRTLPARVEIVRRLGRKAWVEVAIHEGRYRQVRRMFEAVGYRVEKLVRTRFGPLALGSLPRGAIRPLSPKELKALRRAVALEAASGGRRSC
jgi:23S rRNA pseudouridine2605 synthase